MERLSPIADAFERVSRAEWERRVEIELGSRPLEALSKGTLDGLELPPLHVEGDRAVLEASRAPGVAPFVRGTRAEKTLLRVEHDDADVERANEHMRRDLSLGAHEVRVELGIDRGARIVTGGDVAALLAGIDCTAYPIALSGEELAFGVGLAFLAAAEAGGHPLADVRAELGVDPLGTLGRRGSLPVGLRATMTHGIDLAAFVTERAPHVRTFTVGATHFHDAGASTAQEIGFALATGVEYLRRMTAAGLDVDLAATQLAFEVAVGAETFTEIAKLRTLRSLWARLLVAVGASPGASRMRLAARTSKRTKSEVDARGNLLRSTAEAFAAIAGGADSVSIVPFDAFGSRTDEGRELARSTGAFLLEEAGIGDVGDPAGGSYLVEALTDAFSRAGYEEFRAVERAGGMERALLQGVVARAIEVSRRRRADEHATKRSVVVGVSEYASSSESLPSLRPTEPPRPRFGRSFPAPPNGPSLRNAVTTFATTCVVPRTRFGERTRAGLDAVRAGSDIMTLVEASALGRPSFHVVPLPCARASEPFEAVRRKVVRLRERSGGAPKVFVAALSSDPEAHAYAERLLAVVDLDIERCDAVDVQAIVSARKQSALSVALLVASGDAAKDVPVASALATDGVDFLAWVGAPPSNEHEAREAGVDVFVHRGANVLVALEQLVEAVERAS